MQHEAAAQTVQFDDRAPVFFTGVWDSSAVLDDNKATAGLYSCEGCRRSMAVPNELGSSVQGGWNSRA